MGFQDFLLALGVSLFAVFGACVGWLNMKDESQRKFARLLSEAASAAFAGNLVYCMHGWLGVNIYLVFALAGVIGWLGAKMGLRVLSMIVLRNSGLKMEKDDYEAAGK